MCNINYYMVWSVKYRRKILDPEIEEYLPELVQQISEDKGITGRKLFERFLEIRNQLKAVEPFLLCGNNWIRI